jgi:hypothetical protein
MIVGCQNLVMQQVQSDSYQHRVVVIIACACSRKKELVQ